MEGWLSRAQFREPSFRRPQGARTLLFQATPLLRHGNLHIVNSIAKFFDVRSLIANACFQRVQFRIQMCKLNVYMESDPLRSAPKNGNNNSEAGQQLCNRKFYSRSRK